MRNSDGRMKQLFSATAFLIVAYCSYLLVLLSLPYLSFEPDIEFLATKQLIYHIDWWRFSFYVHVFSSPFVIISGLLQFNRYFIHRKVKVHRISGIIYVLFVTFISGPSALLMGLYANGGYVTQISFVVLSVLWIGTTIIAYVYARQHSYRQHANWMIRSYALTLSAITLRIYAYFMDVWNIPLSPMATYTLVSYLSWMLNVIVAEILIRKGYANYLLRPQR